MKIVLSILALILLISASSAKDQDANHHGVRRRAQGPETGDIGPGGGDFGPGPRGGDGGYGPRNDFDGTRNFGPGPHGFHNHTCDGDCGGRHGGVNGTSARGPFGEEFQSIECPELAATEPPCTVGGGGVPGVWVCRKLYDILTGDPYSFTACIDMEHSLGEDNDECGCCGDCPTECTCPCTMNGFHGDGMTDQGVLVLDAEDPDDEGRCVPSERAFFMVTDPGFHGPRFVCDESCI